MKNVTRPSDRPINPRLTLYALRASPDSSLNIGYCHGLSGQGRWRWAAHSTYGHIVLRGKVFNCRNGVSRDPNDVYARVLEFDFL